MPALSYPLETLIPHRPPMVLVDEILAFDGEAKSVTAAVTIRPEWCESWVAIELMAQTAAALAGLQDRAEGYTGAPRPGFLLGTRKLTLRIPQFAVGQRYLIQATSLFSDQESASFACTIMKDETVVAEATLNAYRPTELTNLTQVR